jgi:hypothetical protein
MNTFTVTATDPVTGLSATASAQFGSSPPLFGLNYDVDGGLVAAATTLGCQPFPTSKVFNSSVPVSYPGHVIPSTVTHPLVTIKVALTTAAPWISAADQSALAKVFASMPKTGVPMVTINNEGEAQRTGYTAAQVTGSHMTAFGIFKANAPANAIYTQNFQTFTASQFGRGVTGFKPYICCAANGQVDLPLYFLDWYPASSSTDAVDSMLPAYNAIKGLVPAAAIGVSECNYLTSSGILWNGTQPQWFADCWAWSVSNELSYFMPYFLSANGKPWPPPQATITELSSIAHAAGL